MTDKIRSEETQKLLDTENMQTTLNNTKGNRICGTDAPGMSTAVGILFYSIDVCMLP